jgi:hypothetical protein
MLTIYEPQYQEGQILSEPSFTPLHVKNSHPAWREFRILIDCHQSEHHRGKRLGVFSPKFGLKTKVPANEFIAFCGDHDQADVCLINPFPQIACYSYNVWMQGEIAHPGLTEVAQRLLNASGIGWDLSKTPRHDVRTLCYSNFWVGSEQFWDTYVSDVLGRIASFLEREPDDLVAKRVMHGTQHTDEAPFLPFIVERLFSTYLSLSPGLSVAAYDTGDVLQYCLTDVERDIVSYMAPIVSEADASGCFSDALKSQMRLMSSICHRYGLAHFAANAHPHSGKTVTAHL